MKLNQTIFCILALALGQTVGLAETEIPTLEVTSHWVGEDVTRADNYYVYNCSEDESLAGYLAGATIDGVERPVVRKSMYAGEMFKVEKSDSYYKLKRVSDGTYLYSDYRGLGSSSVASNEFNSQAREYEVVKETSDHTLSLAIGNVYYIRYHVWYANSYRYFRSNGNDGSTQPSYSVGNNDSEARQWIFISERQFEFRPKLDAIIAMVEKANPKEDDNFYSAYTSAVAVQNSAEATTDQMLLACDALVKSYYANNADALALWELIKNCSDLSTQLKAVAGVAPQDMKDAITRAFVKLLSNDSTLSQENDTKLSGSLASVYHGYMSESLEMYRDNLVKAAALGYTVTGDLYTTLLTCKSVEDYKAVAADIRADFVTWLNNRVNSGQGFPAGTDLSMLIVNNSFEVGDTHGWTIDPVGYWVDKKVVDYEKTYNGTCVKDKRNANNGDVSISDFGNTVDGNFYWYTYDVHKRDRNVAADIVASHGYEISQEFSGLPAGTYRLSMDAALTNWDGYPNDYKKVYLNVWVNEGNKKTKEIVCNGSTLTRGSVDITVSGPTDKIKVSACGATVTDSHWTYSVKYIIPYVVDNFQLTALGGAISNMTLDEKQELPTFVAGEKYDNVTVRRSIKHGQWNSLCLPCDMTEAEVSYYFSAVKMLSGVTEKTDETEGNTYLDLSFADVASISAGKAYLVKTKGDTDLTEITLTNKSLENSTNHVFVQSTDELNKYTVIMKGNLKTVRGLPVGSVYLQKNTFFVVGENDKVNMLGFRGWFECYEKITDPSVGSAEAEEYRAVTNLWDLDNMDNESSVPDIEVQPEEDIVVDLSGRRVKAFGNGLYIVNGKKMFIKK